MSENYCHQHGVNLADEENRGVCPFCREEEIVKEHSMVIDFLEEEIRRLQDVLRRKVREMNTAVLCIHCQKCKKVNNNPGSDLCLSCATAKSDTSGENWAEEVPLCG